MRQPTDDELRDAEKTVRLPGPGEGLSVDHASIYLTENGLVSGKSIQSVRAKLIGRENPEAFFAELVRSRQITPFQAKLLLAGNTSFILFGNYILEDRIGEGGMGVVYKARHRLMRRIVAVKILASKFARDSMAVRRFYREVQAAARLEHPHVVRAYDAGQANGFHFLAMEYVDGKDLHEHAKGKGVPYRTALNYIYQAALGLQYAHEQDVIHRDVKPQNLLLASNGVVKLLDLGLARLDVQESLGSISTELTAAGRIMGTVDYMAPEQVFNGPSVDARADIYSLGCTLYFLLAGKTLFPGDSAIKKIFSHREAPAPSLKEVQGVPAPVDLIFQRMVKKDPQHRYQSVLEVISQLDALPESIFSAETARRAGSTGSSTKLTSVATNTAVAPSDPRLQEAMIREDKEVFDDHDRPADRSRRWWVISLVLVAIAISIHSYVRWMQPHVPPVPPAPKPLIIDAAAPGSKEADAIPVIKESGSIPLN